MKRLFYIIAVLLALTWALTFFILHVGSGAHILILTALVCWLQAIITIPATQKKYILKQMEEGKMERTTLKRQRA